jgi:glycogen synthase
VSFYYSFMPLPEPMQVRLADERVGFFCGPPETAIHETIKRAVTLHRDPDRWQTMMVEAMGREHDWSSSAQRYLQLYAE